MVLVLSIHIHIKLQYDVSYDMLSFLLLKEIGKHIKPFLMGGGKNATNQLINIELHYQNVSRRHQVLHIYN